MAQETIGGTVYATGSNWRHSINYGTGSYEAIGGTVYGTGSKWLHDIKLWHRKPLVAQYKIMAHEATGGGTL